MSTGDQAHQRRYFRASVDFPATVIVPGGELVLIGRAIDLSGGGMRVATASELPPGQAVVLRFHLPGNEREMLIRGKVVLSFFDASRREYAHGVVFTRYAQPDQDEIVAYIHELQKQS
ncbi:MAG TPA: PilZ domain-containing protein [Candidatus Baltobacteraceae bacterium]